MLNLRAMALFSILTFSLLNACSDLSSVSLSETIAGDILKNIEGSSVNVLTTPPFGEGLNTNILSLFKDLRYPQEQIKTLNFNYSIVEADDFKKSGFTLNPTTGDLTGKVLPDGKNADIDSNADACLGSSSTYHIKILNNTDNASVTKAFTIEKKCDDCGDLAPFAQYM